MKRLESNEPKYIITTVEHRPNPLPDTPWSSTQRWKDVLFLHWPVSAEWLQPHIVPGLQLDLFDGTAWIGLVFFQVHGMRPRFMPPIPYLSSYLQLNVRTYVTNKDKPGVYFFNLDVNSGLAAFLARVVYSLPFRKAEMKQCQQGDFVDITSVKKNMQVEERLSCSYTPVSSLYCARRNTLDYWLLERYCLWNIKQGELFRTDIHHTQWNLQQAEVILLFNTMAHFLPSFIFDCHPLVHYSSAKQALFWLPVKES
nr:DUF2071 domain-containing protein [uncultured Bacillus sp.]